MTLSPAHRLAAPSRRTDRGPAGRVSGRRPAARGPYPLGPLLPALLLALGLAGCGEGGGAGDGTGGGDSFEPNPIEPLVGTWNLGSDWDGQGNRDSGEALLVIRPVGEDGTSDVRVYDSDPFDGNNCFVELSRGGEAEPDGARREQVFMNNVFPFDSAILRLDGSTLVITYFDADDVNGNGDRDEQLLFRATAVGLDETDIRSQLCN